MATKNSTKQTDLIYVDFPTNMDFHPIRKDLALLTNEDAVKRSVRNIVETNYYERLDPTIGANITSQLFELASAQTQIVLQDSLRSAIENHEPRAQILDLVVALDPDSNQAAATITFVVLNNSEPVVLTVLLDRIR
jgi:phage baseplate assembly protein W